MKKILSLVVILALLVGGFVVAEKMGYLSILGLFKAEETLKIDKTANVVTEIKNISKFTTACYYEEFTLTQTKQSATTKKVNGIVSSLFGSKTQVLKNTDELCLLVKGKVRAGYDLSTIADEGIIVSGDTLTVTLPEIQIFEATVNPSDIEVFIEQGTWTHAEVSKLKEKAAERLTSDAKKNGIMEQAKKSGEEQLINLFKSFGFKSVVLQ